MREADSAAAELPLLVIKAPKETVAGHLVKLDATGSNVDSLEWHLVDGTVDDYDVAADGKRATFSNPSPGIYFFAVAGAKLVDGKALAAGAVVKVTLVSDPNKPAQPPIAPPVNPPSVPPSNPQPPPSPPQEDIAAWALSAVYRTVDPNDRKRVSGAIAKSMRLWADGAGKLTNDPQQFVIGSNKLLDLLLQQMGKQAEWKQFRDEMQTKLSTLGLTTVQQHITVWGQIADGLERVQG